jgi:hypothetical protein
MMTMNRRTVRLVRSDEERDRADAPIVACMIVVGAFAAITVMGLWLASQFQMLQATLGA